MKTIATTKAPAAIGPYSQGKVVGNLVFFSGQIPLDANSGEIVGTTIEEQTHCICKNIGELLKEAGVNFDAVIKTTCFLAEMSDFAAFNEVYAQYFTSKPARSCVAVKALPKNVLAEIEVIAEIS
ncbi:MAG: RidA family protein [bacterium]|nr:RidA family protein [bacterium]